MRFMSFYFLHDVKIYHEQLLHYSWRTRNLLYSLGLFCFISMLNIPVDHV